jgi:hypothetical protein
MGCQRSARWRGYLRHSLILQRQAQHLLPDRAGSAEEQQSEAGDR